MIFKAVKLDEIIKGVGVDRTEEGPSLSPGRIRLPLPKTL